MPIYDPYISYAVLTKKCKTSSYFHFLCHFLPKATKLLHSNKISASLKADLLKAHNLFQDFLKENEKDVTEYLKTLTDNQKLQVDFSELFHYDDCYLFLLHYLMLSENDNKFSEKDLKFEYFDIDYQCSDSQVKSSCPSPTIFRKLCYLFSSPEINIILSEYASATIAVNFSDSKNSPIVLLKYILSALVLAACGYKVVQVIQYSDFKINQGFLISIDKTIIQYLSKGLFIESHIFHDEQSTINSFIGHLFQYNGSIDDYPDFTGYKYIYHDFSVKSIIDDMKSSFKDPYIYFTAYSIPPTKAMKHVTRFSDVSSLFPFYLFEEKERSIQILLNNVPIYEPIMINAENNREYKDALPCEYSNIVTVNVDVDDYIMFNGDFVEVRTDSITKYNVEFSDLSLFKPEFFIDNQLYLTQTEEEVLNKLVKIQDKIPKSDFKATVKSNLDFSSNISVMDKVSVAAHSFYNHGDNAKKNKRKITLHTNQLFAIYEASNYALSMKESEFSGRIYQVETGEGKSFIIQVLAALLAQTHSNLTTKYQVHITTSNIHLAIRDFINSYDFFNSLGLKSAVLVHENELSQKVIEQNRNIFEYNYYDHTVFNNASNTNAIIMEKSEIKIVFSTFLNFEGFFLHMCEEQPALVESYFKNCILLIDEADTILIDELINGTILSKPMKSNAIEILEYIYDHKYDDTDDKQGQDFPKKH